MPDVVHGSERRPLVPGELLIEEAAELSVVVPASCRRTGRCHECVVEVRAGGDQLSRPTPQEAFLRPGFRLACQARVERAEHDVELAVLRRRLRIELAPEMATAAVDLDPGVVVTAAGRYVADDGTDLGPASGAPVGLALDVGTTTVVLELVDLETGAILAVAAFENPQRFGGSDVMTRISYDGELPGELRQALRHAVNHELRRLQSALRIDRRRIVDAVVVGNPTMRDLAFGLDVHPIGRIPYRSVTETAVRDGAAASTAIERRAHELGLLMNPRARVTGGPIIASHVGADAAADLVAVSAVERGGSFLLVDIGTNTEVIVSDGERIVAASSPAGPAFEGGGVRHGMPGAEGAIEGATLDRATGQFALRTIGDVRPEGICGSGLVDLLAELRGATRLTARGGFADRCQELAIVEDPRITLSRSDIGHLSIAKAATAVGQRVLLRRLGLVPGDIEHVYLAGGFANALDVASAIAIGLLVPVDAGRVVRAGNASIAGARALLLSRRRLAALDALTRRIEHVELESEPDFFDLFTDGCLFEPIAA
ncbi:MAG TPA: ASKHA domain-containing protein [Candidatus Limnocylindrales bacterium]|nr:ASKHA domain-containing protein [Candidatus Limnocylindrales bacterium]